MLTRIELLLLGMGSCLLVASGNSVDVLSSQEAAGYFAGQIPPIMNEECIPDHVNCTDCGVKIRCETTNTQDFCVGPAPGLQCDPDGGAPVS